MTTNKAIETLQNTLAERALRLEELLYQGFDLMQTTHGDRYTKLMNTRRKVAQKAQTLWELTRVLEDLKYSL